MIINVASRPGPTERSSESQPPSPPGVFSRTGPFPSSGNAFDGSARWPVLFCGVQSWRLEQLVLRGAENGAGVLHLKQRHQAIAAHRLQVLERQSERHRLA